MVILKVFVETVIHFFPFFDNRKCKKNSIYLKQKSYVTL